MRRLRSGSRASYSCVSLRFYGGITKSYLEECMWVETVPLYATFVVFPACFRNFA